MRSLGILFAIRGGVALALRSPGYLSAFIALIPRFEDGTRVKNIFAKCNDLEREMLALQQLEIRNGGRRIALDFPQFLRLYLACIFNKNVIGNSERGLVGWHLGILIRNFFTSLLLVETLLTLSPPFGMPREDDWITGDANIAAAFTQHALELLWTPMVSCQSLRYTCFCAKQ